MGEIRDYNISADSNTQTPPDGAPEGMAPSTVNNTMREAYARIKRFYNDTNGANTTAGSSNTYTLSASRTVASYAAGDLYVAKFNHSNTGNATLNVDSVGAKGIVTPSLNELPVNSIRANGVYAVVYEASADKFILLDSHPSENQINLKNPDSEDTAGGRESQIVFKGLQSGSEESTLGRIQASHEGTSDDQKGQLIFSTNDGSDSDAPTTAMTISSDQVVTFAKNPSGVASGIVRNYINNPEFSVHQRGSTIDAASVGVTNSDGSYTLDQWILLCDETSGSDIVDVKSQTSDVPTGSTNALLLEVPSDASITGKKFGVLQWLESKNCQSIIGQEVTLSAQIKSTADLDDVRMAIVVWTGSTADAPNKDIVSAWESEGVLPTLVSDIAFSNTPADLGVTTSFAKYSVTATISSSAKNVGVFIWSNVTGTTAGTDKLHIGQVQLEKKSTSSDFSFEPYTDLLQRCQRYFQGYSFNTGASSVVYHTAHAFTASARSRFMLITPMRTGGSITFLNYNIIGKTGGSMTGITYTQVTTPDVNALGFNTSHSTLSGFNTPTGLDGASQAIYFVNAGGFFFVSAEIGV